MGKSSGKQMKIKVKKCPSGQHIRLDGKEPKCNCKSKIKGWAIIKDGKLLSKNPDWIPTGAELYLVFPKRDIYTKVCKDNENGEIIKVEIKCQRKKNKQ